MSKFTVKRGSIYNPGWVVYEELAPRHFSTCGTFEEKKDADEWCDILNREEASL